MNDNASVSSNYSTKTILLVIFSILQRKNPQNLFGRDFFSYSYVQRHGTMAVKSRKIAAANTHLCNIN